MTDNDIIALYWKRDQTAITVSNERYGAYCFAIANAILSNCEDSNECVNSTWLQSWNSMPPQRPNALKLFFAKITRNLAINTYRKNTAKMRGGNEFKASLDELSECVPSDSSVEGEVDRRALEQSINSFLRTLSQRDCSVFLRRYFYSDSVKDIAIRHGLSESNTLSILFRTRKKLKEHLEKEGFNI